jgi:hypothetical protein
MADVTLNFNEEGLDKSSALYSLYRRLQDGFVSANNVSAPDFSDAKYQITVTEKDADGNDFSYTTVDNDLVAAELDRVSLVQMKNSAYMFAKAITDMYGEIDKGEADDGDHLSRQGDAMLGYFKALYGFQAGVDGKLIFEVSTDALERSKAQINGFLEVTEDLAIAGQLNLGDGIYFNGHKAIYYENDELRLSSVSVDNNLNVQGVLSVGGITISDSGIAIDGYDFYHSGNSNKSDVDWTMRNGFVHGELDVDGDAVVDGSFQALGGFSLGSGDEEYIKSDNGKAEMLVGLNIAKGKHISFAGLDVLGLTDSGDAVALSAPDKLLQLGGYDTKRITLHTGIYQYSAIDGDKPMVSVMGDGYFPNSFSAGCANSGPTVMQTYYTDRDNCGVVFGERIALNNENGAYIFSEDGDTVAFEMSYLKPNGTTARYTLDMKWAENMSPFKSTSKPVLEIGCDGEMVSFTTPIEASRISIGGTNYKTALTERALFFDDGVFIEGVEDGVYIEGNTYIGNNIGSQRFASGFAGYGWGVRNNAATFDELTIRKKMRVYELEVQKQSITNGALWVSDSCCGDTVIDLDAPTGYMLKFPLGFSS